MADTERPNIVLVVLDTVRAHDLDLYGYERETMPNLCRFADGATVFDRSYTNAPWTVPAHASLFTGELPSEHGCHGGSLSFTPDSQTLAHELSSAGYTTHAISNNIWISDHFGFDNGFDEFYKQWQFFREARDIGHLLKTDPGVRNFLLKLVAGNPFVNLVNGLYGKWLYRRSDFGGERTTNDAVDLLETKESPFFLFLNYMEAHAPYQYHPGIKSFLNNDHNPDQLNDLSGRSKEFHLNSMTIDDGEFEGMRAMYDGELRYLDDQLARLFRTLEDNNQIEDTLVVIVGDHGENIGDHGLMAHRFSVHDTLLHVPLVIRYPEGYSTSIDASDPVDFRFLYREILRVAGQGDLEEDDSSGVVAEYVDPSYTPEAQDSQFSFDGSRFDKRYATVITRNYKLIRDDTGATQVFEHQGRDFELDGTVVNDKRIEQDLQENCPDPSTWRKSGAANEMDDEVLHHLESLGYR